MYYYVDEYGNLAMDDTSDVLSDAFQDVFPDEVPPQLGFEEDEDVEVGADDGMGLTGSGNAVTVTVPDGTVVEQGESGEISIVTPDIDYSALADALADSISYDDLVEALANVPSYTVYPNTSAVAVLTHVLDGIDGDFGYVIVSGSDTYQTHLYYSDIYTVSGKTITLTGDVTHCYYYQYRPTTSSSWIYTYTVTKEGDATFTLSNQLAYTNLVEGYPDLIPYKQRTTYTFAWVITVAVVFVALANFWNRKKYRYPKE